MSTVIPRGIRNQNPGNIIKSGIDWAGEKDSLDESVFEVFDTAEHGLEALCKLLLSYQTRHNLTTIRGIINRWAPPVENDTDAYVRAVVAETGIPADMTVDLHVPYTLASLCTAIVRHENGQQPYQRAVILTAATTALGVPSNGPIAVPATPETAPPATPAAPSSPPPPAPAPTHAPKPARQPEGLADVPVAEVDALVHQFEAEGAIVSVVKQPNGHYLVTATYRSPT